MKTSFFAVMLLQTALFIAIWTRIHRHVATHGPVAGARKITLFNSRFYSLASGVLLLLVLHSDFEDMAKNLFLASKFYEYVDVWIVRASGGFIDLHFAVHHLTTPYLTYLRVIKYDDGWRVVAALNTAHHVLMYAYFGGVELFRPLLPITGTVQLVVGLIGESLILWRKSFDKEQDLGPHGLCLLCLTTYLVLWIRDLRQKKMTAAKAKSA